MMITQERPPEQWGDTGETQEERKRVKKRYTREKTPTGYKARKDIRVETTTAVLDDQSIRSTGYESCDLDNTTTDTNTGLYRCVRVCLHAQGGKEEQKVGDSEKCRQSTRHKLQMIRAYKNVSSSNVDNFKLLIIVLLHQYSLESLKEEKESRLHSFALLASALQIFIKYQTAISLPTCPLLPVNRFFSERQEAIKAGKQNYY